MSQPHLERQPQQGPANDPFFEPKQIIWSLVNQLFCLHNVTQTTGTQIFDQIIASETNHNQLMIFELNDKSEYNA